MDKFNLLNMYFPVVIIALAFILDIFIGDPVYTWHPVRLTGNLIKFLERLFIKSNLTGIFSGMVFSFIAIVIPIAVYLLIAESLEYFHYPWAFIVLDAFIVYSCFAFRDMTDHIKPIYSALQNNDIGKARLSLSQIVGRDTENLESDGIIRASIESLSESFVDGFLAPVFWYVLGVMAGFYFLPEYQKFNHIFGVMGILIYRTGNTLDSMVGYKNGVYEKFGKFSARFDDVLNFLPARMSIVFLLPAIIFTRNHVFGAIRIFIRDRYKSSSPNAAHSMSVFAGALAISLGGKTMYQGFVINKPVLGDCSVSLTAEILIKSMKIYLYSCIFTMISVIAILSCVINSF